MTQGDIFGSRDGFFCFFCGSGVVIWGHFGVPFRICSCWVMEKMQLWLEACFLEVSGWIFWRIAMLGCGSNTINNESNSMSFVFQKSWLEEVPGVDF